MVAKRLAKENIVGVTNLVAGSLADQTVLANGTVTAVGTEFVAGNGYRLSYVNGAKPNSVAGAGQLLVREISGVTTSNKLLVGIDGKANVTSQSIHALNNDSNYMDVIFMGNKTAGLYTIKAFGTQSIVLDTYTINIQAQRWVDGG